MTEPSAGSDVAGIKTRAEKKGDEVNAKRSIKSMCLLISVYLISFMYSVGNYSLLLPCGLLAVTDTLII